MGALWLLVINAISVLLLVVVIHSWRKGRKRVIVSTGYDLVMFLMTVKIGLYLFAPALFRILSYWGEDTAIGAKPDEIALVYFLEAVSVVFWLLPIRVLVTGGTIRRQPGVINIESFPNAALRPNPRNNLARAGVASASLADKTSLFCMTSISIAYIAIFPSLVQAFMNPDGLEFYTNLAIPVIFMSGPIVGGFLFACGWVRVGKIGFAAGVGAIGLAMVMGISFGSRGQVFTLALWLLFLFTFVARKAYTLVVAGTALTTIIVFHEVMTTSRAQEDFFQNSFTKNATGILSGVGSRSGGTSLMASLEFRLGEATRKSVGFLRLVELGESAGPKPILSALYAPLPRRFFPDKPLLGSADGTKDGRGMYIIHRVLENTGNMSEFCTGLHSYWEFGVPGVVALSLFSGLCVALLINFQISLGIFGVPLLMIMMKPPWLEPKLWTSELISDVTKTLLPLWGFWFVCKYLVKTFPLLSRGGKADL